MGTTAQPDRRGAARFLRPGPLAALAGFALASACTVGRDYERPDLAPRTAPAWREPAGAAITAQRMELARWWERFGSDELTALATRLVAQNLSLAEARQRIVTARARRGIADAQRLPQLSGGAGYTRAGTGDRSLNFQGPPPGQDVDVYSASVTAGWELDLWGRVARLTEAADADIAIAVEDYRDAAVSLLADLALAYVETSTLHQRLAVATRGIDLQAETVRLAQSRLDAGLGTRLDVQQAGRELEATRALLPPMRQALASAENRIAVLLGDRPRDDLVSATGALRLPPTLGVGLPADVLERRADVRRSEQRYIAAVALAGATEAERYPSITLGGTLALRAQNVDTLTAGADAISYSFGPNLTIPLFTGGRIDSAVAAAESEAEAARLGFERAVLAAVAEVETAAAGAVRSRERVTHLQASARAAREAVDLAEQLYRSGARSLLQVIDAQRALVRIEDALLVARSEAFAQTVALYRALGGGFESIGLDGAIAAPAAENTES